MTENSSFATISTITSNNDAFSLPDLSPEQQKRLLEIRKKKHELLLEIQVSELFIIRFYFMRLRLMFLDYLILHEKRKTVENKP
ncbi:hypothetical protein HA402_004846 [Bradysia odoriphaga]|nr:hypothetical protein HA402_004846 [Bradysia odoriphaga]